MGSSAREEGEEGEERQVVESERVRVGLLAGREMNDFRKEAWVGGEVPDAVSEQ
jgi:hypothetical protein